MTERPNIKTLHDRLSQTLIKLQEIYFSTPRSNKSAQKISQLQELFLIYFHTFKTNMPIQEDQRRHWICNETQARYILAHVKIEKIHSLRLSKTFTPDEIDAISKYKTEIEEIWIDLRTRLPFDKLKVALGSDADRMMNQYASVIPSEWK